LRAGYVPAPAPQQSYSPPPPANSNVWQLKAPYAGHADGMAYLKSTGDYVKKGDKLFKYSDEHYRNSKDLKSEVDGYITDRYPGASYNLLEAGYVLMEIDPGKKKGLFG
jgi:hypothetical protein